MQYTVIITACLPIKEDLPVYAWFLEKDNRSTVNYPNAMLQTMFRKKRAAILVSQKRLANECTRDSMRGWP
jgi:hypothetical protein